MIFLRRLSCAGARSLMAGALADDLGPAGRRRLAGHLDSCAACRAEGRRAAALVRELRAAAAPDPGSEYWETFPARVRRRIDSARLKRPPGAAASGAGERASRLTFAAAVAAAVALSLLAPAPPAPGQATLVARALQDPGLPQRALPATFDVDDPYLELEESLGAIEPRQARRLLRLLQREAGRGPLPRKENDDAS